MAGTFDFHKQNRINRSEEFGMKLRNFVLAFIFLSFAAVTCVKAQFDVTGAVVGTVTTANGGGIRRANVTVLNLMTLESETRLANDFGYFRFDNLPIMDLYLVTVNSKRHHFTFSNQLVRFTAVEHNLVFISDD
jgi:hypothetical protein